MKKIKIKYEFKNKDILNSQIIEAKIDNDCISFYDKTNNYNNFDYKRKILVVEYDDHNLIIDFNSETMIIKMNDYVIDLKLDDFEYNIDKLNIDMSYYIDDFKVIYKVGVIK